jgi:hypothetical protein
MVCHLTDGYGMAAKQRNPKPAHNFFTRTVARRIALHTSLTWPKGVKTVPEADQEIDGTKPVEWDRDLDRLLQAIDSFSASDGHAHPRFGPLTAHEWNVWGFKHADHHLRQFGV